MVNTAVSVPSAKAEIVPKEIGVVSVIVNALSTVTDTV
jgi:hypothetical protein